MTHATTIVDGVDLWQMPRPNTANPVLLLVSGNGRGGVGEEGAEVAGDAKASGGEKAFAITFDAKDCGNQWHQDDGQPMLISMVMSL